MSCPGKESSAQTNHQKKRIAIYSDHDRIQVKIGGDSCCFNAYLNYKQLPLLVGYVCTYWILGNFVPIIEYLKKLQGKYAFKINWN